MADVAITRKKHSVLITGGTNTATFSGEYPLYVQGIQWQIDSGDGNAKTLTLDFNGEENSMIWTLKPANTAPGIQQEKFDPPLKITALTAEVTTGRVYLWLA